METMRKHSIVSNIFYSIKDFFAFKKTTSINLVLNILSRLIFSIVTVMIPTLAVYFITNDSFLTYIYVIIVLSVILLISMVVQSLTDANHNFYGTYYRCEVTFIAILDKALTISYDKYEPKRYRDLMAKAGSANSSNWNGIELMIKCLPEIIISSLSILLYGFFIFKISYIIGLITIAMILIDIPLIIYALKVYDKNSEKASKMDSQHYYIKTISKSEKESKDIRNYKLQNMILKILDNCIKVNQKCRFKIKFANFLPKVNVNLFTLIRDFVGYAILINGVINKELNPSEFTFSLGILTAFNQYVDSFFEWCFKMVTAAKEVGYYRDYIDLDDGEKTPTHKSSEIKNNVSIEFKNVSFKYPDTDRYIFKNFNLKIDNNKKIALVGDNGGGKSTLIKLICRLYPIEEGEILINGININDFSKNDYYKLLGVVNQEVNLLYFSIKENIIASSEYDEGKLQDSLIKAGLKDKIDFLKNKEETFITQTLDPEGVELSGGETQKLMLARALYKNAPLLILDEPTSALDPLAEKELYEKYYNLTDNKTSIFISHRLSSTQFCDEIIYLNDGIIKERGTHEELMKNKKEYYSMFNLQARYYREDD